MKSAGDYSRHSLIPEMFVFIPEIDHLVPSYDGIVRLLLAIRKGVNCVHRILVANVSNQFIFYYKTHRVLTKC